MEHKLTNWTENGFEIYETDFPWLEPPTDGNSLY